MKNIVRTQFSINLRPAVWLLCLSTLNLSSVLADTNSSEPLYQLSLSELLNVTISTATKSDETVRETPASVVIISRADIDALGYATLDEILDSIAGLYQINDYAWNGSLNYGVRGFYSTGHFNDMIILINGVNQKENLYDSYNLAKMSLPVELIEKIEVVRGPLSSTYGSGAFMGAINIFTRDFNADQPATNIISGGAGSNDSYRLVASQSGQVGNRLKYTADIGFYDTDGFDYKWIDMVNDPSSLINFAGVGLEARSAGQLAETNLYLNTAFKLDTVSLDLNYVKTDKGVIGLIPGLGRGINDDIESFTTTLAYDDLIADRWTLRAHASYFYYTNDMTIRWSFTNNDSFNLIDNRSYEVETTASTPIGDHWNVLVGLNRYSQTKNLSGFTIPAFGVDRRFILPPNEKVNLNAVFSNINYQVHDNVRLSAGVRVEHLSEYAITTTTESETINSQFDHTGDSVLSNVALIYTINDKHLVKALYGNAIKQPAFGDSSELLLQQDLPQLRPAKIQTFELNYIGSLSKRVGLSANLFFNVLKDLITRENVSSSGQILNFSLNAGEQETLGLELALKAEPIDNFHIDVGLVHMDAKNKTLGFEDIELGYSPKQLGHLTLSYSFRDSMTLGLTGKYVGSMKTKWEVAPGADPSSGGRIGSDVNGYFPIDLNFRMNNVWNRGYFLSFRVSNIFDQEIRYPATKTTPFFTKGTLGPERSIMIRFGK